MALRAKTRVETPATPPRQQTTRGTSRVLVASGLNIKLDDQKQLIDFKKRQAANYWQERSWYYSQEIPELWFAHAYTRNAMSRIGIYPAILDPDDPSAPSQPLSDETAPKGLDIGECWQVLQQLAPFEDYMGRTAHLLDVAGDLHVGVIPDDTDPRGTHCQIYSTDELMSKDKTWLYRADENDQRGTPIDTIDGGFFRLWYPDGRFQASPTSHMRGLLGIADELLLLTQMVRGIARSRIAMAGRLLYIPEEMSLESATPDGTSSTEDAGDGEASSDTFIEDFLAAAQAAILDHESAASAIPIIVRGPAQYGDMIKSIDLDRPIDATAIEWRKELLDRLANGVDLPREVVLGVGDVNHWSAEEIRNQAWQIHLEPRAMSICSATADAFYKPQLAAMGVDPKVVALCTIGYDPSAFIGTPDLADSADDAYDKYLISAATYRREKGYSPDDEPSLGEIKQRVWIAQATKISETAQASSIEGHPEGDDESPFSEAEIEETDAPQAAPTPPPVVHVPGAQPASNGNGNGGPVPPAAKNGKGGSKGGGGKGGSNSSSPAPVPTGNAEAPDAVTAAGGPHRTRLDRLGLRLVAIERDLRTRLQSEANASLTRALERAGAKIISKSKGKQGLAVQLRGVPTANVAAQFGPAGVAALGLTEQTLLQGALDGLHDKYETLVRRAQEAAFAAAEQAAGPNRRTLAAAGGPADMAAQLQDERDRGWAVFSASLTVVSYSVLYDPHPTAPDQGEFDSTTLVSISIVRASLAVAGGADVAVDATNRVTGDTTAGATTGPAVMSLFDTDLGIVPQDQYEWDYGDAPRKSFEPHLDLDGQSFASWDDPALANTYGWPDVDFFHPADHDGCGCDVVTLFENAPEDDGAGDMLAAAAAT